MERTSHRLSKLMSRDLSESLGKLPPQALDLEESILGMLMLESRSPSISKVLEFLKPEHFYAEAHKEIYHAILSLLNEGKSIDMRTVRTQLTKTGKIEIVGGAYYLAELTSKASGVLTLEDDVKVVYEKFLLRELIVAAGEVNQDAYNYDGDPFRIMEKLEKTIAAINQNLPGGTETSIKEEVTRIADAIRKRTAEIEGLTGIPSGFPQIDRITLGWQPTDLIIIAARPSMGKTALAVQAAVNTAVDFGIPVGIFSLEMSSYQLAMRATSIRTGMNSKTLRSKVFNPLDWDNFINKTAKLSGAPIYIDDTGALSLSELRSKARRMVSNYGVKLIIIDYVQLMRGESYVKGASREQEIGTISRGLKGLAKELNLPIILLSQLSRDVEKRGGAKIPILSDLRDSGSLEQDADVIVFPWRPGYYKIEEDSEGKFTHGLTKIIIAKHRNGELGEPFLRFIPYLTAFENIDYPYEHQQGNQAPVNDEGKPLTQINPNIHIESRKPDSDDAPF